MTTSEGRQRANEHGLGATVVSYDALGAARYDETHATRFREAAAVAALLAELHAQVAGRDGRVSPVLELGIGTGRLALPLAARGVEVHGIDASPDMVARLRDKPGGDAIRVTIGDFADAGSLVQGQFSVIFVAFNTLFELLSQDDQVRCIAGAAQRLSANGVLVIEALAPDVTRLEQSLSVLSLAHDGLALRATVHDPMAQVVSAQDVTIRADGVSLRPWSIRYASVPELDLMARLAGLRLVERWEDWEREPFTAASARHVSVYGR